MDNLEKLLPLLLIAAYYIFTTVQSAKKKKESELSKTMLPKGIPETDSPAAASSRPKMQRMPHTPAKSTLQPEVVYNPEVLRTVMPIEEQPHEMHEEEPVAVFEFDAENTDELRRAIIYSEILERKY